MASDLRLSLGKEYDYYDPLRLDVLHQACLWGDVETARQILGQGEDRKKGFTYGVCRNLGPHSVKMAELFLECGVDVHAKNLHGHPPLQMAVAYKNTVIVIWLLDHGADVDSVSDQDEETPLLAGCASLHHEGVKELLRRGADVEKVKLDGASPLLRLTMGKSSGENMINDILTRAVEAGLTPSYS